MNKACPAITREREGRVELLAFNHPLAGKQIAKGTVEDGETLAAACVRELFEESGITASPTEFLGTWVPGYEDHKWGFYLMKCDSDLPDTWGFYTHDDGGHPFKFFWHPLNQELDDDWHELFKGAIKFIEEALTTGSRPICKTPSA